MKQKKEIKNIKNEFNRKEVLKKGSKTISEFKEFIARGNVIDLAVGVIIGGAFGKIVTSIVEDILMPIIGAIIGGINFTGLSIKIGNANITYGNFIQNVIDFLIVAFCIFIFVKLTERMTLKIKKEEAEEKKEEIKEREEQVVLLEEIRDLLKQNNQ